MINWWPKVTLFRMSITCSSFFRFLSVPVHQDYSHFHRYHNDHNDQMRIMLTTWQLSRCPLLRWGGQVGVLQQILNRFNGHRLQWYFRQRPSHIVSILKEIGYFATKAISMQGLPPDLRRPRELVLSLSWREAEFIKYSFYPIFLSRPSSTLHENKFPIRVPAPEYVGGGEAELAGDVVQRRDHQVVKVRASRPGRGKEAWARIYVH